MKKLWHRVNIL